MQIGVIGLGHMGGNMSRRLMQAGHHCVVFDANAKTREALAKEGAAAAGSLAEVVKALGDKPRAVWVMFLYARFRSREEHTFGEKMLSAMLAETSKSTTKEKAA
jgi:6-phosphogluconate dehydrogenase (decarboxylating)